MMAAAGLQEDHWAADCPGQGSGGQYGAQGTGAGYQSASGGYKAPGSYTNPGMSSPPKAGGPSNSGACFKCGQVCHCRALCACMEEQYTGPQMAGIDNSYPSRKFQTSRPRSLYAAVSRCTLQ